jgi:hypothetical protein
VADAGSTFTGWSGNPDCSDGVVTMNMDVSCTATFTQDQYRLTISETGTGSGIVGSSPSGISCGADCSENYNDGTVVSLTPAPIFGSVFAGWSGAPDCTDGVVTMDADKSCTATFNIPQFFTLSVDMPGEWGDVTSDPPGIDCGGEDCDELYEEGTVITLTPVPGQGDYFDGWSGDPDCSDGVVTMDSDITCLATFIQVCIPNLILPVNSEPNMDNGCQFAPDSIVWDFDWSDCTGASQYNLYVKHPSALNPVIDETNIISSSYHYDSGGGYITEPWRYGREWRVRAMENGVWGHWSQVRTFDVELQDTDCPQL